MHPAEIVKRIRENNIQRGRINFLGRSDPVGRLGWIVMLKLPCRLCVIKSRRVAGKLKLLHQLLGAAVFAFQQPRHVDVEFDELRRLAFVSAGYLAQERFKSIARRSIIFFLQWHQRQIELRLPEF